MKKLTIIDVANITGIVPQYLYKVIKTPIAGQVYDENIVNYGELKRVLFKKFGEDKVNEMFEINNFDEIEIEHSTRKATKYNYISRNELEINEQYIVKSYHYEVNVKLINVYEVNNDTLYLFELINENNKINQDKYRVITANEFDNQSRYKIIK